MGGPARMTDARGKDTQLISVDAQDNMLHVDNTPFREEHKILPGWEKGETNGPTGQNFTFLPGTHMGTRSIRTNEQSQPWSTENDSLLITDESIDKGLSFQRDITGSDPKVLEGEYPQQPITVLSNAGSLVNHRYRNNDANTRGCVIAAFHLASDHPPGAGHQDGIEVGTFLFLARRQGLGHRVQDGRASRRGSSLHPRRHGRDDALGGEAGTLEIEGRPRAGDLIARDLLVHRLAAAMAYDKHGLLDLIIYRDAHEEMRKPARKSLWTRPRESIAKATASVQSTYSGPRPYSRNAYKVSPASSGNIFPPSTWPRTGKLRKAP